MGQDLSTVPIGQTIPVANTSFIRSAFTRISEQYGIMEHYHPTNGTLVLKARVDVHTGAVDLQYQDQEFWKVTVNGRPIGSGEQASGKLEIDPATRTINIKT